MTFKAVLAGVLERMRPACEDRDAWSVAEEFVPLMPAAFRDKLAVEYLVIAYFRDDRDRELTAPVKKPKRSPKRSQMAAPPDDDAAIEARFWLSINSAVDTYTKHLRAEITAELLSHTFTIDDGTEVTWGEASAHQHRTASMEHQLEAADHLTVASRHQVAITMLDEAGVTCLNECVDRAA